MMKLLLLIVALIAFAPHATAQDPAKGQSSEALQSCLLGMHEQTWAKLKLTSDQLMRVSRVQEACKTECEASAEKEPDDTISNASGSSVLDELRGILSEEQYRAWTVHCAGGTTSTEVPK